MKNDKVEKRYAEGFLFLFFIMLLGFVTDPHSVVSFNQTDAEVLGDLLLYIVYFICFIGLSIKVIMKGRKKDRDESDPKNKKSFKKNIIAVVILWSLLILFATPLFSKNNNSDEVGNIVEDALYGTEQSENTAYVSLISEIFTFYGDYVNNKLKSTIAIDSSNILEFDSFETKDSLNRSILLLRQSISELEKVDEVLSGAKEGARQVIKNHDLPEDEKAEMLRGFNNSINDENRFYLTKRRYDLLKSNYQEILELYYFLNNNFNDYIIDFDEYGEENVFFYSDSSIDIYNQYISNIDKSMMRFTEVDSELMSHINKQLKEQGLDVSAEEIRTNFME